MKTNEIISMTTINTQFSTFKDDRLNKATQRIASIYNDAAKYADTKNREIAKILGEIAEKKSYEADGFKSVADYANTIFGIARQNAYSLANAGKIYNDSSVHPELKAMSPSKLAEISSIDNETLTKAIADGKITRDTTQKALREFAETTRTTDTTENKVLDTYTVKVVMLGLSDRLADTFSQPKTIPDWEAWFIDYMLQLSDSPVEVIKLPKGRVSSDSKKANVIRYLFLSETTSIVANYYKYTVKKPISSKPVKYTKEQLQTMLAALEADQNDVEE